jgi:hypothetical protein
VGRARWDTDERFVGIASGRAAVPPVRALVDHCERGGWITEDPDAHLLPHLRRACERPDSVWRLREAALQDDGVYLVRVDYMGHGDVVRDAVRLLSVIAEPAFFVRKVGTKVIDCVTGVLDGDGEFASHGHLVRLQLS